MHLQKTRASTRLVLLVLLLALGAGVIAGCGDDAPNEAEVARAYGERMNAICSDLEAELAHVKVASSYFPTRLQGALEARRSAVALIEAETSPAGMEQAHTDLIEAQTEGIALADEMASSLYPTADAEWNGAPLTPGQAEIFVNLAATNRISRAAWRAVGVDGCG